MLINYIISIIVTREISNSKTQIVAHVSLNTSVTEGVRRTVGRTLYQTVDSKKCLDLDPSCVALNNQTYIGNSTSLSKSPDKHTETYVLKENPFLERVYIGFACYPIYLISQ